ncbi:MAG: hypothetical protein RSD82_13200 [Comamonas sp.]
MARRKDLKNIASGLAGHAMSRNNDINGYWSIGMLCLHALHQGTSQVTMHLWPAAMAPANPVFDSNLRLLSDRLRLQMAKQGITESWVHSVCLALDFDAPSKSALRPFQLQVTITDDHARAHCVSTSGLCRPHNPRQESKSNRRA